jgi:F0F1-type ATP synthase membrane subunit c/vacuolar-type H+-ATPase subunit K
MHKRSTLVRLATGIAVALTVLACALPATAATAKPTKGRPSAAAIAAWSPSYRARERAYQAQLAALGNRTSQPSPAAVQAWSDDYRAMWDLYQQRQLAATQREVASFHFGDAFIGGGIAIALAALGAAGFYVIRSRKLGDAASESHPVA